MLSEDELNFKITKVLDSVSTAISKMSDQDIENYSASFHEVGFVQIPSIVNSDALKGLFTSISDNAYKYFISYQGKEREYFNRKISGHKFKRLFFEPQTEYDIATLGQDENWKKMSIQMQMATTKLSKLIQPIMTTIANNFAYTLGSIFYYGEGDFIGLHHDAHYCEMINAQFPLSINAAGCIRILYKGKLKPFYDVPGCLNILGAKTWHDVPLVSKTLCDEKATRMNLTLRYTQ